MLIPIIVLFIAHEFITGNFDITGKHRAMTEHSTKIYLWPSSVLNTFVKHTPHLAQDIAKWHFSSVEALLRSEFRNVIMALSLELSGILWWNFAYTLILTRYTPWDCQMTFEIVWVFAEVQILKQVRLLQNDIYYRLRLYLAPNSEKGIMALSLELSGILW